MNPYSSVEKADFLRAVFPLLFLASCSSTHVDREVKIGPGTIVLADIVVERKITLHIHESASTGQIYGAEAIRYSDRSGF